MSAGKVVIVSDSEFEQTVLKSEVPVMLDFWAEWCQPCKMLAPTVEELAGEYDGKILVGKLNVDDNPTTSTNYGIRGIPTLLFVKGGQVVQQLVGVKSKAEIKKVIEETLWDRKNICKIGLRLFYIFELSPFSQSVFEDFINIILLRNGQDIVHCPINDQSRRE